MVTSEILFSIAPGTGVSNGSNIHSPGLGPSLGPFSPTTAELYGWPQSL